MAGLINGYKRLIVGILNLAPFWRNFILLIILINGILPLFLIEFALAKWVLFGFYTGAVVMGLLTWRFGFVRLLGISHLAWLPFVVLIWNEVGQEPLTSFYSAWLWSTAVVSTFTLFMDAWDALRYFRGERDEMVSGLDKMVSGFLQT